ncbi:4-hydroxythreonine-4-phosphate dehydrogenase PdxA [Streptomyces sp. SKN60]|uniref:4-hydroxythreonine-4-phosphate dehydrogenase PdxA n=1 Tax=Streptomyces sp. SKN60 TaxID=2855506 RepID=UPI002245EECA|nr:4-hydroxythreonine-4-phosphate dehydrogenase PdxA [Streptomyces sp. SKN60]MCX2181835.1 4-hydroxythreonine-4-phosphate dehydrogenase PdxA [Streptomyces sp. SKN60]
MTGPGTGARPIAVTMGDPHGIGPEITVRACADPRLPAPVLVIGDTGALTRACRATGVDLRVRPVGDATGADRTPGVLDVLPTGPELPEDLALGTVAATAGAASYAYVRKGIALALAGQVRALTTAPVNKEALRLAGVPHPGHTEILAELTGTERYAMMMANDELRVVLVTVHQALREAIDALTVERELDIVRLAHQALARRIPGGRPRIAVAGLNPHAGENGLFGREDLDVIAPAVRAARAEGIDASGPWPADTVFLRARAGEFDAVVAQYHDQGLIPVKYLGLEHGVNITLGLPFVRTSVDHGTAFDLAGTGTADHRSLLTALRHAAELTPER